MCNGVARLKRLANAKVAGQEKKLNFDENLSSSTAMEKLNFNESRDNFKLSLRIRTFNTFLLLCVPF